MDLYWLNDWEIPADNILLSILSDTSYLIPWLWNAEFESVIDSLIEFSMQSWKDELVSLINSLNKLSADLKSAVTSDDYQPWLISASKYIDGIIWIACQCFLWSSGKICRGFWLCHDAFNWLNVVHAEWIALPLEELYQLVCEQYIKSLPTASIPPPSLTAPLKALQPLGHFHPSSTPGSPPLPSNWVTCVQQRWCNHTWRFQVVWPLSWVLCLHILMLQHHWPQLRNIHPSLIIPLPLIIHTQILMWPLILLNTSWTRVPRILETYPRHALDITAAVAIRNAGPSTHLSAYLAHFLFASLLLPPLPSHMLLWRNWYLLWAQGSIFSFEFSIQASYSTSNSTAET